MVLAPALPVGAQSAVMHSAPATHREATIVLRPGRHEECAALSALALRSKSHWGYDQEFLEAVRVALTFTAADFEAGPIWALDLDGELTGVYQLVGKPPEGELAGLWLDPHAIGSGLGRVLFLHALETASEGCFESLLIESDPNAMGFYLAMGAAHVGHRRSDAGRWLPLLRVTVPSAEARASA